MPTYLAMRPEAASPPNHSSNAELVQRESSGLRTSNGDHGNTSPPPQASYVAQSPSHSQFHMGAAPQLADTSYTGRPTPSPDPYRSPSPFVPAHAAPGQGYGSPIGVYIDPHSPASPHVSPAQSNYGHPFALPGSPPLMQSYSGYPHAGEASRTPVQFQPSSISAPPQAYPVGGNLHPAYQPHYAGAPGGPASLQHSFVGARSEAFSRYRSKEQDESTDEEA